MSKWKFKINNGVLLRDAIEDDNNAETLNMLRKCWSEIHEIIPDVYTQDELEDDIADIENQLDNLENYEDYGMTIEDCQDEINWLLEKFYDYCDDMGIWVGLK